MVPEVVTVPAEETLSWAFAEVVTKLTTPFWLVVASTSVKLADFVVDTLAVVGEPWLIATAVTVRV
jgi:hypothetical protein